MATVLTFKRPFGERDFCPICARRDGQAIISHLYIGYCDQHRIQWLMGRKTAPGQLGDTEAEWNANSARLFSYGPAWASSREVS